MPNLYISLTLICILCNFSKSEFTKEDCKADYEHGTERCLKREPVWNYILGECREIGYGRCENANDYATKEECEKVAKEVCG
ncbi:kunitz-type serine protease inhibitor A-like [Coccinella septempunctata]|uniref:kunitz-type serine protease inhibitor A-like n=1 Tax=Coccinella septempunctata TaxID=41139 RepID=UPI001D05E33D|nr:kunitz-type serine protease inhibitor A-like [Coccinella septempunctata]